MKQISDHQMQKSEKVKVKAKHTVISVKQNKRESERIRPQVVVVEAVAEAERGTYDMCVCVWCVSRRFSEKQIYTHSQTHFTLSQTYH